MRAACLHPSPRRALAAEHSQQVVAGVERERLLEQGGGVDRARLRAVGIEPEQRAHRDPHREVARPVVEVHVGARLELLDRPLGLLVDRLDRVGDVLAVEGGQHDAAGAAVEVAVDRQQPVAHQPDQVAEAPFAPLEVGGVRDEDVVVRRRPEHEDDVAVQQPQREDGAEALVALEQHLQRFRRRSGACAAARSASRPAGRGRAPGARRGGRREEPARGLRLSIGGGPTSATPEA